ncbi:tumor necrosis factor receptor superfamily member 18 [Salarias fasciatus]|uniref:tumor necrosis factor receptor superfamily member 18 n=1 Tax=Salarias fasciatus TaxID=181472 RepID=UPI00117682AD|nr:tumor necrosis factor receptor superfamily member 3-like [Salarias fasciatus]
MMSFPNLSVANMPVYVLTFWIVGLASGCGDQQTKEDGICCNMCPPGTYLEEFCSLSKQTDCKPCEKGFFSDQYSNFDRCEKCRSCPKAYAENCTATTNAKCACSPGFLCSNSDCSDCEENKCVTGFEPKRKVKSSNGGLEEYSYECEPLPLCPQNTFFDAGSCKPRTHCGTLGLAERFPGNETHDSVCEKLKSQRGDGDSTHLLLGLGCIFLSVAILLFLSYRGIKKLRKHRANKVIMLEAAAKTDDFQLSKEESGHLFIIQNESEDSKSMNCPI